MNELNSTEIYQCLTCNVEISKLLYESSDKEAGHDYFKMTLKEGVKPSWSPYYPYQKLRRKKLLEDYYLVPARCTTRDMAINLDYVSAYPKEVEIDRRYVNKFKMRHVENAQ